MTIINKIFAPKDNADDEVLVSRLFFSNGQKIKKNDDLAELETSKTSISISSEEDGFIEYCVNEDDYVKVGEVIILIHSSKKSVDEALIQSEQDKNDIIISPNEKIISENARKYIEENNINISSIEKHFVTLEDVVQLHLPSNEQTHLNDLKEVIGTSSSKISLAKLNEIKALASVQSSGIVSTIFISIDSINKIEEYKRPLFAGSESLLPLVASEASKLLLRYPVLNAFFDNNTIRIYDDVNLGIAFDIDDGLKVYTIKNSDKLSMAEIENRISDGIDYYLNKSLKPDQISGSTFTITDLSSCGASMFVPLINFNQSAILGISGIDKKLNRVSLSLSFDHRVTEGKVASQFLEDLKERIEEYFKIFKNIDDQKVDAKCCLCLKTLSEDKKMNGVGLINILNHDGENILICNICLENWT
jgi:pyruvate/2-oxoglutarate dehydrogenase complex dihydrolipoamide acyltransferase (E2) component